MNNSEGIKNEAHIDTMTEELFFIVLDGVTLGYALTHGLAMKILNILADEKVKEVSEKYGGPTYVKVLKETIDAGEGILVSFQLLGYVYNSSVEIAHRVEYKRVNRLTQRWEI